MGGIYPGALGLVAFIVFVSSLDEILRRSKEKNITIGPALTVALTAVMLSSVRVEYLLFGLISVVGFLLMMVLDIQLKRRRSRKEDFVLLLLLSLIFLALYPRAGTNARWADLMLGGQLELSEPPAQILNESKGIYETGAIGQRLYYMLTAPVYYYIDIFRLIGVRISVWLWGLYFVATHLIGALFIKFAFKSGRVWRRYLRSLFFATGVLLMPAAVKTGHVQFRYVAPLIFASILFYFKDTISLKSSELTLARFVFVLAWITPTVFFVFRVWQNTTLMETYGVRGWVIGSMFTVVHGGFIFALYQSAFENIGRSSPQLVLQQ